MAFKMTPGIKGNPAQSRVAGLGACGGPGQPPCEPRFEKEVKEEKLMRAIDRSSSSIRKSIKPKIKQSPIKDTPVKPAPKLTINLPKGHEFKSAFEKRVFYNTFEEAIEKGKYKTQEELDRAIEMQLKGGPLNPKDPKDPKNPELNPEMPISEGPIVKPPGKGGPEFEKVENSEKMYESALNDKLKAASIEQAKARFVPVESSAASKVKPKA